MVKRKAAVAFSIFTTMFASAWWFHTEQTKVHPAQNPDPTLVLIGNNSGQVTVYEPFKPREYIRVVAKKKKEKEEVEPT